jgi:membrane protein DedA with SNARE-associated domain
MDCHVLTAVAAALGNTALSSGSPPVLPGFLNSLAGPLDHYGLWAILLLVLIEDFGIPVPGETVLIAGAVFAGSGQLNVVWVGVVGFIAAVVGDNIGYAIGRFGGRLLVERWGKYVFLTPERLDKAEAFFNRHGGKIITIARFIEGLRQANGLIAGITEMHWLRFIAFNALGAALWVGTWVSIGYFAGQHITGIYNAITTYSLYAAIVLVVAIVAFIVHRVRKHRRTVAAARLEAAADERAEADKPGDADPGTPAGAGKSADADPGKPGDANGRDDPGKPATPGATVIPGAAVIPGKPADANGQAAPGERADAGRAAGPGELADASKQTEATDKALPAFAGHGPSNARAVSDMTRDTSGPYEGVKYPASLAGRLERHR